MELVSYKTLVAFNVKMNDFDPLKDGQIYFDTENDRHAILCDGCTQLHYIGGGFKMITPKLMRSGQFLLQPDFFDLMQKYQYKFSMDDLSNLLLSSRSAPLEDCIKFCLGLIKLS